MSEAPNRRAIRIGAGAGFAGDRIEPSVELARDGALDYLVFECLAERTIALAQHARLANVNAGYDPLLEERMRAVLPICHANGTRIVTNMGAANPRGAAMRLAEIASEIGIRGISIAVIGGDDVLHVLHGAKGYLSSLKQIAPERILSANAYLGAAPIVEALERGADIVITGRVSDPSLFLAPLIHEFGWALDDWDQLGCGTVIGHLLECAGQITGGYFAEPGFKDVPNLARLGFPLAEVNANGTAVIEKLQNSGGSITIKTCTEQLLYEISNPACYITPDVCADFSNVRFEMLDLDRIHVSGARGRPAPNMFKVSVGYLDGFIGEGQISYAGQGAVARARLALEIVLERLRLSQVQTSELRGDLIGVDAVYRAGAEGGWGDPCEVRLRVAGRTSTLEEAKRVGQEVESLYTNGPAAGGGARKSVERIVAVHSILIPRAEVNPFVEIISI